MLIGVVSDTHNRVDHVKEIVNIFNEYEVELVIHTGDITNSQTLQYFQKLKCPLKGVFGNNDLNEIGLEEICLENNFDFKLPPYVISLENKKIAIFHEPDLICSILEEQRILIWCYTAILIDIETKILRALSTLIQVNVQEV